MSPLQTSLYGGASAKTFGQGFGAPITQQGGSSSNTNILAAPANPLFQPQKGAFLQQNSSSSSSGPASFGGNTSASLGGGGLQSTPSQSSTFGSTTSLNSNYLQQVQALYQRYNPSKINDIPLLLEKHRGREAELVQKIREKYEGATAPAPSFGLGNATATVLSTPPRAVGSGFGSTPFGVGASTATPTFGANSGFGQTSGLGATSGFGQTSALGASSGFGQTSNLGSFGSGSGFGSQQTQPPRPTGGAPAFGSATGFNAAAAPTSFTFNQNSGAPFGK